MHFSRIKKFVKATNINIKTLDSITYYNDFEIIVLLYEEALKKDKRIFFLIIFHC